jgi:hypothetical protein
VGANVRQPLCLISYAALLVEALVRTTLASASARTRSNSNNTGGANRLDSRRSLVLRDRCNYDCRGFPFPSICAAVAASLSGTLFLAHQTPCSFCLSDMLTSIVYTTQLYHLGRFKPLIVRDIQVFQGLRGTLAFPTGRSGRRSFTRKIRFRQSSNHLVLAVPPTD